jgi:hypothetical protein
VCQVLSAGDSERGEEWIVLIQLLWAGASAC